MRGSLTTVVTPNPGDNAGGFTVKLNKVKCCVVKSTDHRKVQVTCNS